MVPTIAICLFVAVLEPTSATEALKKMIASRRAFVTADLGWVNTTTKSPPRYFRNRYDGANWTYSNVPDPDGIRQHNQLGEPYSCTDASYLVEKDRLWHSLDRGWQVSVWKTPATGRRPHPIADARAFGLMPENIDTPLENLIDSVMLPGKAGDASLRDEGNGIVAVSVKSFRGTDVTWWLDTAKNYNPIRIERRGRDRKLLSETTVDLHFYDDHVWFPSRVQQVKAHNDGSMPSTVEFIFAEFDRPNHPAMLTPKHLDIPVFTHVRLQDGNSVGSHCWTGSELITLDAMHQLVKDGVVTAEHLADYHLRVHSRDPNKSCWPAWYSDPVYGISKPADIDEWEKYVRRFCLIRKCDDRQKASAKAILDDCRKTAGPMLARITTEQAKEKDAAKRDAMLAPIADIFTRNLVPRLESLLATAQSQPTTRPVAGPSGAATKS